MFKKSLRKTFNFDFILKALNNKTSCGYNGIVFKNPQLLHQQLKCI